MNNTADDYSSRKISNTPSKKGVFEMNSNSNSNEVLNVNNLSNVNESSTFFHADDSTNLVHRMKESNEKKEEEEGKSSNKRKEDDIEDVKDRTLFHADDLSNIVHRMKQGVERIEERKISKEKEAARIKKKRENHLT